MGVTEAQRQKAEMLLSLHSGDKLLVLPNVWNPVGARVLESKGFPAVATASAAISASLGYDDGEKIKRETAMEIIGRIARSVQIPVTADIEAGYGDTLSGLEETVELLIGSGAAGVNIEDSVAGGKLRPVEDQCRRISTVREAALRQGLHLVINARIDSYFSPRFTTPDEATEEAVARAKAYREAGADCVYPMGPGDETTIRALRSRIKCPINVLVTPSAAPLSVLQRIGVNRASFGPFLFRSCLRKFSEIADSLAGDSGYGTFADMMSRAEVGAFLQQGVEE